MGKVIDFADENEEKMFIQFAQYIYKKYKRRNLFMCMGEKVGTGFVTRFHILDENLAESLNDSLIKQKNQKTQIEANDNDCD